MGSGRDKRRKRKRAKLRALAARVAHLEWRIAIGRLELERTDECLAEARERERRLKAPLDLVLTEHDTPTE